jgi:hypothetical protein
LSHLKEKFTQLCNTPSDINEHLPTLKLYAQECNSVFETGVRGVVSSYALLYGLVENTNNTKKIIFLNDIHDCVIDEFKKIAESNSISVKYEWINNLELEFLPDETYDLTFIDTWHIYGQLKRELDKFSKITNKYIIMHDTEIDGIHGETKRPGGLYNDLYINNTLNNIVNTTKIPQNEILNGLQPAIDEFVSANKDWVIIKQYRNNNGLTILKKIT